MAIAMALPGFNDLECSAIPKFLSRNRFCSELSPHCPKMNKNSMWEVKKMLDFCPRYIESYACKARETIACYYSCVVNIIVFCKNYYFPFFLLFPSFPGVMSVCDFVINNFPYLYY